MLHIDQVLNVNILFLTLISSSAFNVSIYVAVFTTPFEWNKFECLQLIPLACHSNVMPCESLNFK